MSEVTVTTKMVQRGSASETTEAVSVKGPPVFPHNAAGPNVSLRVGQRRTLNTAKFETVTLELSVEWPVLPEQAAVAEAASAGQRYVHERLNELEDAYRRRASRTRAPAPTPNPFG